MKNQPDWFDAILTALRSVNETTLKLLIVAILAAHTLFFVSKAWAFVTTLFH